MFIPLVLIVVADIVRGFVIGKKQFNLTPVAVFLAEGAERSSWFLLLVFGTKTYHEKLCTISHYYYRIFNYRYYYRRICNLLKLCSLCPALETRNSLTYD